MQHNCPGKICLECRAIVTAIPSKFIETFKQNSSFEIHFHFNISIKLQRRWRSVPADEPIGIRLHSQSPLRPHTHPQYNTLPQPHVPQRAQTSVATRVTSRPLRLGTTAALVSRGPRLTLCLCISIALVSRVCFRVYSRLVQHLIQTPIRHSIICNRTL